MEKDNPESQRLNEEKDEDIKNNETDEKNINQDVNLDAQQVKPELYDSALDTWLGVSVEFDYLKLNKEGSLGFYWYYKCMENPIKAPILVSLIGGPGKCVVSKAFGRFNPLGVKKSNLNQIRNNDKITDKYHLLYIESPVGSGFSYAKVNPKTYQDVIQNCVELLTIFIAKNKDLANVDWFFNGEGSCGLILPEIMNSLSQKCKINCKGLILENPIIHTDQLLDTEYHFEIMERNSLWKGCCHKCCNKCCMKCGLCLYKCCSCFNHCCFNYKKLYNCILRPFNRFKRNYLKTNFETGKVNSPKTDATRIEVFEYNPMNICEHYKPVNEIYCSKEIQDYITSDKFNELVWWNKIRNIEPTVKKQKKVEKTNFFDENYMYLIDSSNKFSSIDQINYLIKSGSNIMFLTGEGDYSTPTKCLEKYVLRYIEIPNEDIFWAKRWEEDQDCYYKNLRLGFEWKVVKMCGNLIYVDNEKLHTKLITEFLDKNSVQF